MDSYFDKQVHSKTKQVCPPETKKDLREPPNKDNEQAVKNEHDDMQSRNRFESFNIFLKLWRQFETAFKLEMSNLTKSSC